MKFFRSDSPAPIDRTQALACIPQRNTAIQWEQLENGEILFTYPLPLNPLFRALHKRFNKNQDELPSKKLQLDRMGSFVWQCIDGRQSVRSIIELFAREFKITHQEAEQGVTAFLKTLGQRGFIILR